MISKAAARESAARALQMFDVVDKTPRTLADVLGVIPACLAGTKPDTRRRNRMMVDEAIDRKLYTGLGTGEPLGILHALGVRRLDAQ